VLTGTIYDYDSVYIVYNGKHYEASCDDISTLDELIKDFVSDAGYAEGSYENMTYSYIDAAYTDEYGISYRDFKVSFNAYGNRYSFHYAGSIEIPAHTSTEDASTSQNSAVQDSTPQNSAVQDSTPQNSAVQEDVPQNSVVQDSTSQNSAVQEGTQQNSVSQSATSTVSETVTNTDTANESSSSAASKNEANTAKLTGEAKDKAGENTDLLDDLGRWLAIAIVVSVLFGMAISYIYMKKRGRTVVTVDR
jgi:hypothetical protein